VGRWVLIVALAIGATAAGYLIGQHTRGTAKAPAAAPGNPTDVIAFSLPDLDGHDHSSEEWGGRVVVLNFWATWCPPCREEIPMFVDLQALYGGRGLQFVGVAIDDPAAVRDFRDEYMIEYPLLVGGRDAIGLMTRYGNLAGVLPFSVVIDRTGTIRSRRKGAYTRSELTAIIEPLLAAGQAPTRP